MKTIDPGNALRKMFNDMNREVKDTQGYYHLYLGDMARSGITSLQLCMGRQAEAFIVWGEFDGTSILNRCSFPDLDGR